MRELDVSPSGFSIIAEIEKKLKSTYQLPLLPGIVEKLLVEGSAVLIFDGLDELLEPSSRRRAAEVIEIASTLFPLAPIIVTCRQVGYLQSKLRSDVFAEFSIEPFDEPRIQEYLSKWFSQQVAEGDDAAARYVQDFMVASRSIADMRANPLLLSFISVLYHGRGYIPRNRPQLFGQCIDLLLRTWDSSRGVSRTVSDAAYELALAEAAEFVSTQEEMRNGVPEEVLTSLFADHLQRDAGYSELQAISDAKAMVEHCKGRAWILTDVGLSANDGILYAFTHSSFREYFHAWALSRRCGSAKEMADELYKFLRDGRSQVTVQLGIHLFDWKTNNGGSLCIGTLLEQIAQDTNITAEEARSSVDVLIDAVAAVQLQTEALTKLCREVLWQVIGPSKRPPSEFIGLLSEDFRHVHGIPAVLPGIFASLMGLGDSQSQLRLCWLVTHPAIYLPSGKEWVKAVAEIEGIARDQTFDLLITSHSDELDLAWHLAARRGLLPLAHALEPAKALANFTRIFEPCNDYIAEVGENLTSMWLLRITGLRGREQQGWLSSAVALLRMIGQTLAVEQLAAVRLPDPWSDLLRARMYELLTKAMISQALRRTAGWDPSVRLGLGYVTVGSLDVFTDLIPSALAINTSGSYEGDFQLAYQLLLGGARGLSNSFYRFLTSWTPGQIWTPEWDSDYGPEG
jgi:hypothetical protein